jgi:predicted SnoaL-like aldol condensation-catalyzing enzyme
MHRRQQSGDNPNIDSLQDYIQHNPLVPDGAEAESGSRDDALFT